MPRRLVAVLFVAVAAPFAPGVEKKELDQYEQRFLQRWTERVVKVLGGDRYRLRAELEIAFPGRVLEATTEEQYATWFDLLAGKNDQWWRDDAPSPQLADLFDRAIQRLDLGPVPSMTRDEFARYAKRVLRDQNPPPPGKEPNPDEDADRVFRVLDRDGDGALDDVELTTELAEQKLFADLDDDGRVSKAEYRDSFRRRVLLKTDALLAKDGTGPRPSGDLPQAKNRGAVPEWFTRLDADKDGQLSLYECRTGGGSVSLFTEMDLNGDGYLTREEYTRYVKAKEATEAKPVAPKSRGRW